MVPESSPVTDAKHWQVTGALLALVLLLGENVHLVSPIFAYTMLANVDRNTAEVSASMDLSLCCIKQLQSFMANTLLPWMIIPPCKDWRALPPGHQTQLLQVITNLDINVRSNNCSYFPSHSTRDHPLVFKHVN